MLTKKLFRDSLLVYVFIELTYTLSTVIDGVVISRVLGSQGIAAMGVSRPIFSIFGALSGLLAVGLQARCSTHLGKGDIRSAQKVFGFAFPLWMLLASMIAVFGVIFAGRIASFFGAGESGSPLWVSTRDYLVGVLIGAPALIAIPALSAILQMDSSPKLVRYGVAVMTVANIAGDLLVGYVIGGGEFGMGLATSIANYLALGLMLTHFFRKDSMFRLRFELTGLSELAKMLSGGAPHLTKCMCKTIRPILVNRFIFAVGAQAALAAYSVQNNFRDIMEVIGAGTASTVLLLGGVFFSERDTKSLDELAKCAFTNILVLVVPVSAVVFWFSPEIAAFYIKDSAEAAGMAGFALRALAVTVPLQACGDTILNMQQASKHMGFAHFFTILNRLVLIVVCTYTLGTLWGVNGIWLAFPVSAGLLVVLEIAVMCVRDKKIVTSFLELFSLPEKFSYTRNDDIEASPRNAEEVIALSVAVGDFCKRHEIDDERSYIFALCVEELGMNVINHGFSDGKRHEMAARLIYDDGDLVFRLRDDCGTFNMKKRAVQLAESPPEKGIGIKMVMQTAKDVRYVHVLKTNTLIITV
ncbi:MAG: ATP-binding protein [Synergistaceae bacterium]|nr:ATP-binding protein [Synergistaceae bacterium]